MELDNFYKALTATGVGMLVIFIFMFIFYLIIISLERIFPEKEDLEEK